MHNFSFTTNAAKRIAELALKDKKNNCLRISVNGGGCSGFQYKYELVSDFDSENDVEFVSNDVKVIIDKISLQLVNGSVLDFIEQMDGSYFEIKNPNAKSGCGCGNSFSI